MRQKLLFSALAFFFALNLFSQGPGNVPEHGFLPGQDFRFYPTIQPYNFQGFSTRVEVYDDRDELMLERVNCSNIRFTNTSEFANPNCIYRMEQYMDTLLKQSGAVIDPTAKDVIQVRLEGIDVRLIGFIFARVHGLCQLKITYRDLEKTYCVDITDADKNSPVGSSAWVTRLTATRIIGSAAIREVIEQFFADLKTYR